MISTSMNRTSAYKASTGFARRLLMTAAVIALPSVANADFRVLNNPGDPNFNQLLGISGRIIVGYFGANFAPTDSIANHGYVLVPKNHYSVENFLISGSPAAQTQAIGINNRTIPEIVGFYTDFGGFTHGFLDVEGDQLTVDDPKGVTGIATPTQNLLGINDNNKAAGFWIDNNAKSHGFVVDIKPKTHTFTFIEVGPSKFPKAVSSQVSGINNNNEICGFWTDAKGITKSFFGPLGGALTSFSVVIGKPVPVTQALGCNDNDEIVGTFTDFAGNVHGFRGKGVTFNIFDAPGSSQTPTLGVTGTTINGVNNAGDIVGFFSDGTKVNGFVDYHAPVGPE